MDDGLFNKININNITIEDCSDLANYSDELIKTIEFDTVEERDEYIKSRGWD